jgi:hypothetical protein
MNRTRFASALAMAALAAILLPSSLTAQITFQRTYGGAAKDVGASVQQTSDGGYIATGYTYSYGAGRADVYLVKTNSDGETLWARTYGGDSTDCGCAVALTPDGGYIISGYTRSFGAGLADVYVIRTDADGDTLWTRTYGGAGYDYGYSMQQTADGGYIIAGYTWPLVTDSGDVYLVKIDADGDTLWTGSYGGPPDDQGWSVSQTADSGFIVVGYRWVLPPYPPLRVLLLLVRTDARGNGLWTRAYNYRTEAYGYSVQQTTDGGYIVAGTAIEDTTGDVCLIKTNSDGDTSWTRIYGGAGNDGGYSVQQTSDSGYLVVGQTSSFGAGSADVWVLRTDGHGDTLWTKTLGGIDKDWGTSSARTSDGGYIITGYTYSFGAGGSDVYLIKTDSLGNVAASVTESSANPTRTQGLSLTCEPNPFRTRTAISLQLTADSPAELAVFDVSGRCVRTLTANRTPCTAWDGRDDFGQLLPSGAYFVRLDASDHHACARVVLQR